MAKNTIEQLITLVGLLGHAVLDEFRTRFLRDSKRKEIKVCVCVVGGGVLELRTFFFSEQSFKVTAAVFYISSVILYCAPTPHPPSPPPKECMT